MTVRHEDEDALFDDIGAEEERMAAEEQAEMEAAEAEEEAGGVNRAANMAANPEMALAVLDKLREENEEMKDKALRAVAEMENMRRRTAKEVKDTRSYAVSNFARDMLGVSDNLTRAIQAIPEEKRTEGSDEFKALIEGVEMTQREMMRALEGNGVKKFNPEGEKFDPNIHQAMFEMPNPEVPNNSVGQVVAEGYMIGERVLRPAMVGVAKGGPKWDDVNPESSEGELSEDEIAAQEAEEGREEG